jgi:hypothetical protein
LYEARLCSLVLLFSLYWILLFGYMELDLPTPVSHLPSLELGSSVCPPKPTNNYF